MVLPAWSALIAHDPAALSVTVLPLTLQAVESVEKVTAFPEAPPVALTVNGGSVATLSASGAKSIACGSGDTVSVFDPALVV